ncbi:MAG: TatD family hydrolase [Patescibacteria group bacterium]
MIDTHCHLSFKAFDETWREAVKRAREKDIQMICVGAAKETSEKSITIAKEDGVFASIGLHPTHVEDESFDQAWFSEQADNPKVVAIGETGIDHYHLDETRRQDILSKQEDLLLKHLSLAKEKDLPVILHSRDGKHEQGGAAYEHLCRIITSFGYFRCVLHCYGGDWEHAKKFLDLGCMVSFTGIVTYKNASESLIEVVKNIPRDRFMIETDSPYLAPEPMRGTQNEPAYVEHVARGIAKIRGEDYDTVAQQTTENARRFFRL